ncbi:GGDEF domain-containing protein [Pelagibacterium lacus]|nr:GGDEF domain-containing protein [Pelagibacterium lacus]
MARSGRLPAQAWASISWHTLRHMAVAVVASVIISHLILGTLSQGMDAFGLTAAIVAPLALGGPMVFYTSLKHYQLEMAYRALEDTASKDSLTKCLNHGAFVDAVGAALAAGDKGGALLVADADHFKSINDRFGHASGDAALKLIVSAIRSVLGSKDLLGRLGGEEFGIYLPEATSAQAQRVADTIRQAITRIEFGNESESCVLSVSIGGAVATQAMAFNDLFRLADEQLYKVKATGRNNSDIVLIPPRPANGTASLGTNDTAGLDAKKAVGA